MDYKFYKVFIEGQFQVFFFGEPFSVYTLKKVKLGTQEYLYLINCMIGKSDLPLILQLLLNLIIT